MFKYIKLKIFGIKKIIRCGICNNDFVYKMTNDLIISKNKIKNYHKNNTGTGNICFICNNHFPYQKKYHDKENIDEYLCSQCIEYKKNDTNYSSI